MWRRKRLTACDGRHHGWTIIFLEILGSCVTQDVNSVSRPSIRPARQDDDDDDERNPSSHYGETWSNRKSTPIKYRAYWKKGMENVLWSFAKAPMRNFSSNDGSWTVTEPGGMISGWQHNDKNRMKTNSPNDSSFPCTYSLFHKKKICFSHHSY